MYSLPAPNFQREKTTKLSKYKSSLLWNDLCSCSDVYEPYEFLANSSYYSQQRNEILNKHEGIYVWRY